MLVDPGRRDASRLSPPPARCPDCGQPAVLCHKGRRLVRCAACSLAALRARKRAYQVTHRAERQARRRQGGVPCPPYEAWGVEALRRREKDEPWTCVVYGSRGRAWPEALVTFGPLIASTPHASRLVGACTCGEAGCVHLVVACLAQQAEGGGGRVSVQVLSYGGGTQSVAMCVLVAQGRLPRPDYILAADTGREAQSTWDYMQAHTRPLLAPLGLEVAIAPHALATVDLFARDGQALVPAFTATGMLKNYCSHEWKRRVLQRWLRARSVAGATFWIGFTLDERTRARATVDGPWRNNYPLLDLMLSRADCERLIVRAGLPLPAKSACFMCPFRSNAEWRHIRDNFPADWQQALTLDEEIRAADEQGGLFLHRSRVPLAMAPIDTPETVGAERQCGLGTCFI